MGIAFPHGHMVQPNTPPPDFEPTLITEQLHRIATRKPAFLGFAHFGADPRPQKTLALAEERLWEWVRWVEGAAASDNIAADLRRWVLDGYRAQGYDESLIERYDRNSYWPMQAAGIERWLAQQG